MINLSKKTEVNKKIPKNKIYEHGNVTPATKKLFIEQVKSITWKNKLSKETLNILAGETVKELHIFEIELYTDEIDKKVLLQIDGIIPYHIVFILKHEDKYKTIIAYKEKSESVRKDLQVSKYYQTKWLPAEDFSLEIKGLDLDKVYENLILSVDKEHLTIKTGETIKEAIHRDEEIQALTKKINSLTNKKRKTKQFNKQVKISDEIRKLKKELEKLQ